MQQKFFLNRNWKYCEDFQGSLLIEPMKGGEEVEIPHTMRTMPFHYYDSDAARVLGIYQRTFFAPKEWQGKRLILTFEGVAHFAQVYVNGVNLASHHGGYSAFWMDIGTKVVYGQSNLITVRVDARDGLNQPPFTMKEKLMADYGGTDAPVDDIIFGGIYRDVTLEVKEQVSMDDVFYMPSTQLPPDTRSMSRDRLQSYAIPGRIETWISLSQEAKRMARELRLTVRQYLNEHEISNQPLGPDGKTLTLTGPVKIWDIDSPNRYRIQTDLLVDQVVVDTNVSMVGFREARFRPSGFYLNGRKVKLRGIIRHQSYPYVGYAMPEGVQRQDAKILKEELFVNAVRSAYCAPSPYFLDACDQLGLLVFAEIPGWRNVGDKEWQEYSLQNVREMIIHNRNHPSIILWGTRISGSITQEMDKEATRIAHELDPTRATGGERLEREMVCHEDVYTYSDYTFHGENEPIETKEDVASDMNQPYLISGYLGQSFPVHANDPVEIRTEQVRRAAMIMDAIAGAEDVCGGFAGSMCDYPTKAEFAEEDGISYQGYMDSFRNPKPVAAVIASQNLQEDILSVTATLRSQKERWSGYKNVYVLTNAERVMVYRDDIFVTELDKSSSSFKNLRHGPLLLTDFIGDTLEAEADFTKDQSKRVKRVLNQTALYGLGSALLQPGQMMDAIMTRFFYRMGREEILDLYDQYISGRHIWRFDAIKNDKVVKSVSLAPGSRYYLRTDISNANIIERHGYDVVAVRVRVTDEYSHVLTHYAEHLRVQVQGPLEIIGPSLIPFRGGMCGLYLKSIGEEGPAEAILSCEGTNPIRLSLTILRAQSGNI